MMKVMSAYNILVDYNEPEAIAKAIEEAKFNWKKFVGISLAKIPLVGSGKVVQEVREVYSDNTIYSRELPNALKNFGEKLGLKGGYKFADPLTALRLTCTNPNRQRQQPLATLFSARNNKVWCLLLFCFNYRRCLHIQPSGQNDVWDDLTVNFLVVPADE